jgi:hypothetical protein
MCSLTGVSIPIRFISSVPKRWREVNADSKVGPG